MEIVDRKAHWELVWIIPLMVTIYKTIVSVIDLSGFFFKYMGDVGRGALNVVFSVFFLLFSVIYSLSLYVKVKFCCSSKLNSYNFKRRRKFSFLFVSKCMREDTFSSLKPSIHSVSNSNLNNSPLRTKSAMMTLDSGWSDTKQPNYLKMVI